MDRFKSLTAQLSNSNSLSIFFLCSVFLVSLALHIAWYSCLNDLKLDTTISPLLFTRLDNSLRFILYFCNDALLLGTNGLMSIDWDCEKMFNWKSKFINKNVLFLSFSVTLAKWQSIDEFPTYMRCKKKLRMQIGWNTKTTKIADKSKENDYFVKWLKSIKNSDDLLFTQKNIVYLIYIYFNQMFTNNE